MALAVATAIAVQFSLPNRHIISPTFLFPAVESLLSGGSAHPPRRFAH